jgi:hypothetical protein
MLPLAPSQGHLVRAIGADDEDGAIVELAAQVKEEAAGGQVNPVQVFDNQE